MKMDDMIIVSVDDHVVEPPETFIRHYPADKKDRAPHVRSFDGSEHWVWTDTRHLRTGLNAVVGRDRSEYGMEPTSFTQMRKGCYDPKARVEDMDVNGILGSVNFPSFAGFAGGVMIGKAKKEPEDALLAVRAYNDWHVHEWCGGAPGRLIPLALLPLWDMAETVAELNRMAKLGVHAIAFPDNPTAGGLPSIHNSYWAPVWYACSDLGMILNCHIGTGVEPPHASLETPIDAWITTMPMAISNAAADWLWAPFWKDYPSLRMVLSEGGIGWVPYLLERADHTFDCHHEWTFTDFGNEKPSETFHRHIVTCFIDDRFGLRNLDSLNADMVCYECDYPHADTLWPKAPEYLWNSVQHLDTSTIDKITHANAMRLYNYAPFQAMGGRENCTVGHLRSLALGVDTAPRKGLGGLKPQEDASQRRPVTSGDILRMFANA